MRFAARRAGSATRVISRRIRAVCTEKTMGRITSESSEAMMKTTGTTVVQVLSEPTLQMLSRSGVAAAMATPTGRAAPGDGAAFLTNPTYTAICLPRVFAYPSGTMASERRDFQRLRLAKPILALLDGKTALILDIGVGGPFVEHYGTFQSGEQFALLFRWKSEDVEFLCQVRRSAVVRGSGDSAVSHTGARFVQSIGKSEERLQARLAPFVGHVLAAQKANAGADGDADTTLAQLGGARRARTKGY